MDIVRAVSSPSSRLHTIEYHSNTALKHLAYILRTLKENEYVFSLALTR
jgi:predicted transcriptional regulator